MRYSLSGFTLIEMLLYLSIASALLIIVSTTSIGLLRVSEKTTVFTELHYANTLIAETLERVARDAYAVTSPLPGATSSAVTFSMHDTALNPTRISIDNGVVSITEGTGTATALHGNAVRATMLEFINTTASGSNDAVRMTLSTTASTTGTQTWHHASSALTTSVILGNTP